VRLSGARREGLAPDMVCEPLISLSISASVTARARAKRWLLAFASVAAEGTCMDQRMYSYCSTLLQLGG